MFFGSLQLPIRLASCSAPCILIWRETGAFFITESLTSSDQNGAVRSPLAAGGHGTARGEVSPLSSYKGPSLCQPLPQPLWVLVLCRVARAPGRHREPRGTHLTVTPGARGALASASAVSADQAGGWAWTRERGLEFYRKMSSPFVQVCLSGFPRQCCALRSRGRPQQSFVGLSPLESSGGPLRCRECRPQTLQPWLGLSKATWPGTRGGCGGQAVCG